MSSLLEDEILMVPVAKEPASLHPACMSVSLYMGPLTLERMNSLDPGVSQDVCR